MIRTNLFNPSDAKQVSLFKLLSFFFSLTFEMHTISELNMYLNVIDPVNFNGRQYPTVVFEVGVSQSLQSLHECAAAYLSSQTSIQIYVALKLYPPRQDNTMVMIALMYRRPPQPNIRPQPNVKISFGTAAPYLRTQARLQGLGGAAPVGLGFGDAPLTQRGMPLYQLVIPKEDLFHGVPDNEMPKRCFLSEWLFPKVTDWIIDLWDIQEVALCNA
jgi:hypothetical protein